MRVTHEMSSCSSAARSRDKDKLNRGQGRRSSVAFVKPGEEAKPLKAVDDVPDSTLASES